MIERYLSDTFSTNDDPTIEDNHVAEIEIDGEKFVIELMDTSGNEGYAYLYEKVNG